MSETPDVANLTYELLKRMQGQLNHVEEELMDLKGRMTSVETGLSLVRQEIALQSAQIAQLNHRMDRFDGRFGADRAPA